MLREAADHIDSRQAELLGNVADRAMAEYGRRRTRDKYVGEPIFREPGWDILLDLYVMTARGKRVSISSACIASNVPHTTALRCIAVLEAQKLIVRTADADDHRRHYIELTGDGQMLIERCV